MPYYGLADQPISILRAFLNVCMQTPQKTCLMFEGQNYTYIQLYQAAVGWSHRLRAAGAATHERVGLFLENSPAFLAAYLGTHMVGGIVVLINIQYRESELRHILNDAGVRLCVTDAARLPELERVRAAAPTLADILLVNDDGHVETDAAQAPVRPASFTLHLNSDDIALLGYTSGTTGRSKGAMLSHGNLAANSAAVTSAWNWHADDVLLLALPLFHIHGLGVGIHGTFLTGSTVVLQRRFAAAAVFDELLSGSVTMFFGVPTMYTRLIAEAHQRTQNPPPLRLYVSGSAPLDPQTFAEFERIFGQPILERYGMTETVMNLTNPYDGERRPGTVGQPFPGQEARIVDTESGEPVSPGTIGEIQVRGPHVCKGYWQRPDATAEVFTADGWFRTGDLGWCSEDGYFSITGRAKELIISGGYNVYPREIEEVLLQHPDVIAAAVVGLPDPDMGEQVVAVIVSRQQRAVGSTPGPIEGLSATNAQIRALAEALVALCRDHLAAYKKPRRIFFVDELPRNALGKIQKHALRDHLISDSGTT
jgi:malonyl-CoA/methylmalonyl-CoA synthetase